MYVLGVSCSQVLHCCFLGSICCLGGVISWICSLPGPTRKRKHHLLAHDSFFMALPFVSVIFVLFSKSSLYLLAFGFFQGMSLLLQVFAFSLFARRRGTFDFFLDSKRFNVISKFRGVLERLKDQKNSIWKGVVFCSVKMAALFFF